MCQDCKLRNNYDRQFGSEILLVEALASTGPSISVIPAIGTEGGEEGVDKVFDG